MRVLKHENGFIVIDSIGAMTIGSDYEGRARVIVKVDGESVALFAYSKETLLRKINAVAKIMTDVANKGNEIYNWEEL